MLTAIRFGRSDAVIELVLRGANKDVPTSIIKSARVHGCSDTALKALATAKAAAPTFNPYSGSVAGSTSGGGGVALSPKSLYTAVVQCDISEALSLLAAGADPNAKTTMNYTPLSGAAMRNDAPMIRLLVAGGADVNQRHGGKNFTPIMEAALHNSGAAVAALARLGANLNAQDSFGRSASNLAGTYGGADALRALARAGADLSHADCDHETALTSAATRNHLEALRVCLDAGVPPWEHGPFDAPALAFTFANSNDAATLELIRAGADTGDAWRGNTSLVRGLCDTAKKSIAAALSQHVSNPEPLNVTDDDPLFVTRDVRFPEPIGGQPFVLGRSVKLQGLTKQADDNGKEGTVVRKPNAWAGKPQGAVDRAAIDLGEGRIVSIKHDNLSALQFRIGRVVRRSNAQGQISVDAGDETPLVLNRATVVPLAERPLGLPSVNASANQAAWDKAKAAGLLHGEDAFVSGSSTPSRDDIARLISRDGSLESLGFFAPNSAELTSRLTANGFTDIRGLDNRGLGKMVARIMPPVKEDGSCPRRDLAGVVCDILAIHSNSVNSAAAGGLGFTGLENMCYAIHVRETEELLIAKGPCLQTSIESGETPAAPYSPARTSALSTIATSPMMKATAATPTMSTPITKTARVSSPLVPLSRVGITLAGIRHFIDSCGGSSALFGLSTADVIQTYVKRSTASTGLSYCETHASTRPHDFREATVFVSHAWQYCFLDIVAAIAAWAEANTAHAFWFDAFTNSQHDTESKPFEWWASTFKTQVKDIGHTLLCLQWSSPLPLKRAWCLFEIFSTISTASKLEVVMSPSERAGFFHAIQKDILGVTGSFSNVNTETSSAFKDEDKANIFAVVRAMPGGFSHVDSIVVSAMRSWILKEALSETEKLRLSGDPDWPLNPLVKDLAHLLANESHGAYLAEAKELAIAGMSAAQKTWGDCHRNTIAFTNELASILSLAGDPGTALDMYRLSLARATALSELGPDHPETLTITNLLCNTLIELRQFSEAEATLRSLITARKRIIGPRATNTCMSLHGLGQLLLVQGRFQEAEPFLREAYEGALSNFGPRHPHTGLFASCLAHALKGMGRVGDASEFFHVSINGSAMNDAGHRGRVAHAAAVSGVGDINKTVDLLRISTGGYQQMSVRSELASVSSMSKVLCRRGRPDDLAESEQISRDLLRKAQTMSDSSTRAWFLPRAQATLGIALVECDKLDEADVLTNGALKALESEKSADRETRDFIDCLYTARGNMLMKLERFEEAVAVFRKILEPLRGHGGDRDKGPASCNLATALKAHADELWEAGKLTHEEALAMAGEACALYETAYRITCERETPSDPNFATLSFMYGKALATLTGSSPNPTRAGWTVVEKLFQDAQRIFSTYCSKDDHRLVSAASFLAQARRDRDALPPDAPSLKTTPNPLKASPAKKTALPLFNLSALRQVAAVPAVTHLARGPTNSRDSVISSGGGRTNTGGGPSLSGAPIMATTSLPSPSPRAEDNASETITLSTQGFYEAAEEESMSLASQGKFKEAEPLFREVLKLKRLALGDSHPSVLSALHNFASSLKNQGKFEEAEPLYTKAVAGRRKALGNTDPDTLSSRICLSNVMRDQGKFVEQEALLKELLVDQRSLLGVDHIDTRLTVEKLSIVRQELLERASQSSPKLPLASASVAQPTLPSSDSTNGDDDDDDMLARALALSLGGGPATRGATPPPSASAGGRIDTREPSQATAATPSVSIQAQLAERRAQEAQKHARAKAAEAAARETPAWRCAHCGSENPRGSDPSACDACMMPSQLFRAFAMERCGQQLASNPADSIGRRPQLASGHLGEWREMKPTPPSRRWPSGSVISKYCARNGGGEGTHCTHSAAVVRESHWSCCGQVSATAPCVRRQADPQEKLGEAFGELAGLPREVGPMLAGLAGLSEGTRLEACADLARGTGLSAEAFALAIDAAAALFPQP
jgi:tetratricopeptide (TPR) repeat protein